jgi:hypothetical protein
MASQVYNEAKRAIAAGEYDLNADDIRVRLEMTNTTADTQNDGIVNFANFTTNDPSDGSGYVDKALATEAVNKDDANDRAEFDADDVTWTALGAGTRALAGAVIYKFVDGTNANDLPIAWVEFSATPDGSDFTISWNAEGILQFT